MKEAMMPNHQAINPDSLAKPIGPYSQGMLAAPGRLLALAGQGGVDASGKLVGPGAGEQAERIFEIFQEVLAAAGGSLSDIIQLTIYTRNAASYPAVNEARKKFFADPYPTSATVTDIGFLMPGMEVEISALAVIG